MELLLHSEYRPPSWASRSYHHNGRMYPSFWMRSAVYDALSRFVSVVAVVLNSLMHEPQIKLNHPYSSSLLMVLVKVIR